MYPPIKATAEESLDTGHRGVIMTATVTSHFRLSSMYSVSPSGQQHVSSVGWHLICQGCCRWSQSSNQSSQHFLDAALASGYQTMPPDERLCLTKHRAASPERDPLPPDRHVPHPGSEPQVLESVQPCSK